MQIPVEPIPAATVLVALDDPFRVLMLRRPDRGSFAGALVFPGGTVEPGDRDAGWARHVTGGHGLDPARRAIRIAAIRETWEESGVLVAADAVSVPAQPGTPFLDAVAAAGIVLHLDRLHYASRWITPEGLPRRWDARFYLAQAPAGARPRVDGAELVSWEWVEPAAPPEGLLTPTLLNLARLAESRHAADAIQAIAARPRAVVRPTLRDDGSMELPGESGYDDLLQLLD